MADDDTLTTLPGFSQGKDFWRIVAHAALLGVVGAVSGLVFLWVTGLGAEWYGDPGVDFFEGEWWWVAVAGASGLVVALLRRWLAMPAEAPGLVEDVQRAHVEASTVPKTVAVSAVSLIGGASLGPEVALGSIGGGTGGWLARRRGLDDDAAQATTLSGIAGAFGGLFSSPLMATILTVELARPGAKRFGSTFYGTLVASSVSFGLYFAIAGSVFLGIYDVPAYEFEDWHLLAGVGLGLVAAVVVAVSMVVTKLVQKVVERTSPPDLLLPVVGGVTFGLIGVALPLTNFTGSEQLETVLADAGTLATGLLIATLVGKILAFAVSTSTGFIGGPIFPILFIGGITGVIVHAVVPDVPLALAFSCLLAAVPGAIVPAPFSMVLLAALLTQVGALQTAPILIAVGTAFLAVAGIRYLIGRRHGSPTATDEAAT